MVCHPSQSPERRSTIISASSVSAVFITRVVAMLAEIFMLRLEAAARLMEKALPSSNSC
jgi:hypothetical protein